MILGDFLSSPSASSMEVLVVVLILSSAVSHTEPAAKQESLNLLGAGVLGERGDRHRVGRRMWKN